MSGYITDRSFDGRQARIGDIVVIAAARHDGKLGTCLHAGIVVAISTSQDRPYIRDLRDDTTDFEYAWPFTRTKYREGQFGGVYGLTYSEILDAIRDLPLRTWTWPA